MRRLFRSLSLLHEGVPHAVGLVPELDQPAVVHYAVDDALGGALYVAATRDDLVQLLPLRTVRLAEAIARGYYLARVLVTIPGARDCAEESN